MERPIISIEGEYDLNKRPLFKPVLFSAEALDLEQHARQKLLGIRNCPRWSTVNKTYTMLKPFQIYKTLQSFSNFPKNIPPQPSSI